MPEVKWVDERSLHDCHDEEDPKSSVPVLTLDQIEAWLRREDEESRSHGERGYVSARNLLARVQAWRGGGNETT